MLRADVVMLEALCFLLCQCQDVAGSFREAVEFRGAVEIVNKLRWSNVFSLEYLS